jgi:hypothetical protein
MDLDPELDALLSARRPQPDPAWVQATERRLLPQRRRFAPRAPRALRLGGAVAVGLALFLTVLSLAGSGPFGARDEPVSAKDRCRDVRVARVERVPALVHDAKGRARIVYHRQHVTRAVRRCP